MATKRAAKAKPLTLRESVEATLTALRDAGRLEQVDEMLVASVRSLADVLDVDPSNASLWREFRAFEQRLRSTGSGGDELAGLLAEISNTATS